MASFQCSLKVAFLAVFYFLFSFSYALAQAPGCPNINAGADQNLTCATNCTTLSSVLHQTGATTSYVVSSVAYAPPTAFTGGTNIIIGQDDIWGNVINLPFNFCFYGNMYDKVVVGANGLISFNINLAGQYCNFAYTASIPSSAIYANCIMGAYHDMEPSLSGNINYFITGVSPCRMFTINFNNIPHYQCDCLIPFFGTCKRTTQQIVIYETTNVIEVYIQKKELCNTWNGGRATIGIQNEAGTDGICPPGRNTGQWTALNEGWRFTPNGTPNYSVKWYSPPTTLVGTGLTLNVCPTGTTTYTAEATYQHCDGSTVIVNDQVVVNLSNGFNSNVTVSPETCTGCNGSATVTTSGGTPPFTYNIGNGNQSNGTFTGLCGGNYTITVADNAGCSGTVTPVIAPYQPMTITTVPTNAQCGGGGLGSVLLTVAGGVSPYTYNWSNGQTIANATGLAAGSYTVTVRDAINCSATKSVTITQPNGVSVSVPTQTNVICSGGNNGTATAQTTGGNAPYTFQWSNNQSGATASGLSAGTYTVAVVDANTCTASATVTISEPPLFVATVANTSNITCAGGFTGNATATVSNGAASYTYIWSNGQNTASISNLPSGNYSVTVTDAGGCTATATNNIAQPAPVSVSATSTNITCGGLTNGTATANPAGGTSPYAYSWSNGSTLATATGLAAGNYTLTLTDATLCTATGVTTVSTPATMTFGNTSTNVSCLGGSDGSITFSNAANGTSPYEYSIDGGSVFQSSNQFGTITAGVYSLVLKDATGCSTIPAAITITEPPGMTLSVSSIDASCNMLCNGRATVSVSGASGSITYSWSDPAAQSSATALALCAGIYTVTTSDGTGCSRSISTTVNQPAPVTVNANGTAQICIGQSTGISASATGVAPFLFGWMASPADASITDPTQSSQTVAPLTTTTYAVSVIDANGCVAQNPATVDVTVMPQLTLNVTTSGPSSVCPGMSANLTFNASGGNGNYTYTWSGGAGTVTSPLLVSPSSSTQYTITVNDGCGTPSASTNININIYPLPLVDFSAGATSGCIPFSQQFTNLTQPLPAISNWNFGDSASGSLNLSTLDNPLHIYNSPGQYTVRLTVVSADGCTDSLTKTNYIEAFALPVARFSLSPEAPKVFSARVQMTDESTDANAWLWNFGDSATSTAYNPFHLYQDTGVFIVRLNVSNQNGCIDSTFRVLKVIGEFVLYVPNAFSPNSDGENDVFSPKGEGLLSYRMRIFNRWGEQIFSSLDISNGWDGKSGDAPAQEGVYPWIIELTGLGTGNVVYKGHVVLVR